MKVCTIRNCNEIVVAKGLCNKHYIRFRIHGDAEKTIINVNPPELCTIEGCNRKYEANGLCHNHYMNNYSLTRRKIVIWHYSGGTMKCSCCGESIFKFLNMDHENNDGAEHHRQGIGTSDSLISWLIRNHFPPGFRVLCYNCNCGRQNNGGICPHMTHNP